MTFIGRAVDDEDSDVVGDEDTFNLGGTTTREEVEDDVQKIFRKDVRDACKVENPKPDPKPVREKFIKERRDNWDKKMHDQKNFLHYLADQRDPQFCQQWVVARAVRDWPKLMGSLDINKLTPLTVAILRGNQVFYHSVLHNISDTKKSIIKAALKSECTASTIDNARTCLQAAFSENIDPEYILRIIDLVPSSMFTVTDPQGRTPLHLAVDYGRRSEKHVKIVESLLSKGPGALDIRTFDVHKFSVYQYHDKTRRDCKEKERRAEDRKIEDQKQMKPPPLPGLDGGRGDEKMKQTKKTETIRTDRPFKDSKRDAPVYENQKASSDVAYTPTGRDKTTNLSLVNTRLEAAQAENSPTTSQPTAKVEKSGEGTLKPEVDRDANSDKIMALLRLAYLRRMKPLEALDHIHIHGQKDKEYWFDFGPESPVVKRSDFEKQFDHLNFDETLQYVAFPRIEIEDSGDLNDQLADPHEGRRDMKFFFEWLKKRGVKRIIRVEIDDMKMPCHSDEGIEEALEGLKVEALDWKRLDLDPVTIQRVGDDLREICLYWSGRNSVLRSWSEKDGGLCMTESLENITIKQVKGLESKERTLQNLETFRARLENSWKVSKLPKIDDEPLIGHTRQPGQPSQPAKEPTKSDNPGPQVDPHQWMQSMEAFAESFRQIPELRKKQPDSALRPVTIALIDDGVKITHPELRGLNKQNFLGKSFDDYYEGGSRVSPYWTSRSGHGTLMARLIRRICPSANVYVIKVKTIETVGSRKVQIEPKSAIKAIKHASEIGAHIISMSWTTNPPDNAEDRDEFDRAIKAAESEPNPILMFCASSDKGSFADFTYPHESNPSSTFKIGAAKATGGQADFTGTGLNFLFPGQDVVLGSTSLDGGHDHNFENFVSHTGSSVATALAAGLAGVVYECVRLGVIHTNRTQQAIMRSGIAKQNLVDILKRSRMKKSLESIGVNRQSGTPYVEVWNRFGLPGVQIKESEGSNEAQLETVSNLARLLLETT